MPRHLVISILALFISFQVRAEVPMSESKTTESTLQTDSAVENDSKTTYLICKSKSNVRTLRVLKEKNGSCVTTYTKDGLDQKVGHSWTIDRCFKVLSNIRINLEKSNWKCKDISEARVSSSE